MMLITASFPVPSSSWSVVVIDEWPCSRFENWTALCVSPPSQQNSTAPGDKANDYFILLIFYLLIGNLASYTDAFVGSSRNLSSPRTSAETSGLLYSETNHSGLPASRSVLLTLRNFERYFNKQNVGYQCGLSTSV